MRREAEQEKAAKQTNQALAFAFNPLLALSMEQHLKHKLETRLKAESRLVHEPRLRTTVKQENFQIQAQAMIRAI